MPFEWVNDMSALQPFNAMPLPSDWKHVWISQLSGTDGTNRCKNRSCHIAAQNDADAICCWLSEYAHRPSTYRSYQKEAERLILWCVLKHHKPFSSLDRADLETYMDFLGNPQPRELWCGPKGSQKRLRGSVGWRPFVGPLSESAKRTSLAILDSLFNYLVQASYLDFNPLSLMRRKTNQRIRSEVQRLQVWERILEDEEWNLILQTLLALPEKTSKERDEKARLRFLIAMLFLLGLRIQELASHSWGAFQQIQGDWWFFVVGKGSKPGKIPVNSDLLDEVKRFRQHLRLSELPKPDEEGPLIPSWLNTKALGTRQMGQLLKNLATKAAEQCTYPHQKEKLFRFSPHWIRHLSATMQDRAGIRFGHIKANHRHENEETTRKYVHAIDQERHQDMMKLRLFRF